MPLFRVPRRLPLLALLSLLACALLPGQAAAMEVLDREAFTGGLRDALFSWRHLVAGLAIGLWASQLGERSVWQIPVAYIFGFMITVAVLMGGLEVPGGFSWGVSVLLIALGVLMAAQMSVPTLAAVLIALFGGAAQGYADFGSVYAAHVLSGGEQKELIAALFGIASAMFMLVVGGIGASVMMRSAATEASVRVAGVAMAVAGLLLLDFISIQM